MEAGGRGGNLRPAAQDVNTTGEINGGLRCFIGKPWTLCDLGERAAALGQDLHLIPEPSGQGQQPSPCHHDCLPGPR